MGCASVCWRTLLIIMSPRSCGWGVRWRVYTPYSLAAVLHTQAAVGGSAEVLRTRACMQHLCEGVYFSGCVLVSRVTRAAYSHARKLTNMPKLWLLHKTCALPRVPFSRLPVCWHSCALKLLREGAGQQLSATAFA